MFFVIPERKRTWEGTGYLGETCRLGVVEVVHAVPDRLEDPSDHQQNMAVVFIPTQLTRRKELHRYRRRRAAPSHTSKSPPRPTRTDRRP